MLKMTRHKLLRQWFCKLGSWLAFGGVIVSTNYAVAQQSNIVPDNTLGASRSVVTPNVDINGIKSEQISGGASRGINLFHSFQEFNIKDGRGAYFTNPTGIENILTRVTGSNASSILGKLGVLGNANLFLINPKGIIFGKNASLDIKGSFVASTASSLNFADGTQFSATAPQTTSLLTVSVPIGLQYGENVGSILNQSSGRNSNNQIVGLQVEPDKTLALVGGDVTLLGGRLTTAGGRIELGSVADNSLVSLNATDNGYALGYESVQNFQDIKLSQRAVVNASGSGGGNIQLSGRHVKLSDGSQVQANTNGSKSGGILAITASDAVEIIGTSADGKERSRLTTETRGDGAAGALSITTKRLSVQNGALISTGASLNNGVPISAKKGAAGNLTIRASDVVEVIGERADSNFESRLTTQTAGSKSANAGDITITTNRLVVKGGGQISAGTYPLSQGEGGNLTITASDSIEVTGASADGEEVSRLTNFTRGEGNAKDLTITTGKLIVQGGGRVHAGSVSSSSNPDNFSLGSGGNLNITASDSVEIIGGLENSALRNNVSNRSRITTQAEGAGNAGNLTITTGKLVIQDGAQVSAGTLGASNNQLAGRSDAGDVNINVTGAVDIVGRRGTSRSGIFSNVGKGKVGNGGNITIDSGSLSLRDGARLETSTSGQGNAGNVIVRVKDTVSLAGAGINNRVEASGVGKGGNIDINAATLLLIDGAQLQTATGSASNNQPGGQGDAGNININVTGAVDIVGGTSATGFFSYVGREAVGNAGNITIDSGSFSLQDGARLSTQTYGQGNAGNVTVRARDSVSIAKAYILSTVQPSGVGRGGNIDINAATLSLIGPGQLQTATLGASNNQPGGRGDAGNVNINVTEAVEIAGEVGTARSGIFSFVGTGTVGNAGNITINSGSLSLQDGARLSTQTYGQGNAGNVTVRARDSVSIAKASILSTVQPSGVGRGGNININAATLSLIGPGLLQTATLGTSNNQPAGRGDAGNVNINVTGAVDIAGKVGTARSGIFSFVGKGKVGNGGNITVNSGSISLRDGARIETSTSGQGNAGNVIVRVKDTVSLAGAGINSRVETSGVGKGGNIDLYAATLSLIDAAQLQTATGSASDNQPIRQGDAGNVNINVTGAVDIAGKIGTSPSGIFSYLGTGTIGNAGNITIDSGSFSLRDGARLSTQTYGQGNAGNVTVRTKDAVSLAGEQTNISSTVEAGGVGKGGNIDLYAATLSLTDGAQLLTRTRSASDTQPAGRGNAGNVNVNVTGAVDIAGRVSTSPSGIFSRVETGTEGNGGKITIDSGSFSLRDGARLEASTFGQGDAGTIKVNAADFVTISGKSSNFNSGLFVNSQSTTGTAGNIEVTSPRVTLANSGTLKAESASGNGGNINLQNDLLIMRRGAQISTTAGTAQAGGDGGNINIDAPSGFIVAASSENNDITANAFSGSGGRVTINATGIFGMTVRSREDLVRLLGTNLNPQFLPTNDITAFSQTNPTLNGTITVNSLDVDPNRGLLNLPTVPIDTSVVQGCTAGGFQAQSKFVITGRGGLPSNAGETLTSNAVQVGLVTLKPEVAQLSTPVSTNPTKSAPVPIVEATGWVKDANGNVVLTANASTVTPYNSWQKTDDCRGFNS